MNKKKPSWLRLDDFLSIAAPGIATLGALFFLLFREDVKSDGGWQWLMLAVGLGFIAIWVRIVFSRKAYLSRFRWYASYGLMVHPGDRDPYSLPEDHVLENAVRETVNRWSIYYGPRAQAAIASDVIWVFFKKDLDENTVNRAKAKVEGITFARSHTMQVDYDLRDQPLSTTSFEHELGHIIMGFSTGDWDQESHHKFARSHGLR
jgi:hypothetical protein